MGNLKSWTPGLSGNPSGRPKGTRNLKTVIRNLLDNVDTYDLLPDTISQRNGTPLEAIVCSLTTKAMEGDVRAADVLLKYAVDREMPIEEGGFFSTSELNIRVIDAEGKVVRPLPEPLEIDDTGQIIGYEPKPEIVS